MKEPSAVLPSFLLCQRLEFGARDLTGQQHNPVEAGYMNARFTLNIYVGFGDIDVDSGFYQLIINSAAKCPGSSSSSGGTCRLQMSPR